MLSLLYSMDGGSDQANSSFEQCGDDSVILNTVRSRKRVTESVSCPVCSCTIREGELEAHLSVELDRLQKLSSGTKRKLSSPSPAPVAGSSNSLDAEDTEVDTRGCLGGETYQRVHHNRLRRLRSRSRRSPAQIGQCPVCDGSFPVSKLQRHALRCLKRTGAHVDDDIPDTSSEEGSIDVENDFPPATAPEGGEAFGAEYRWCGEWRVRASALQERGVRTTLTRRASGDKALVVDGDEDEELYGPPQFSPSRIAQDAPPELHPQVDTTDEDVNMAVTIDNSHAAPEPEVPRKYNGLIEASAETRIQALRERIKDLESRNRSNEAKCLICLGPYAAPVVSIQCWHVYCEVCWLESLKAKKICPQCNIITTTQHLRRIYM